MADEAQAGAEQVAQPASFARVGVGGREGAALEEAGDGLGVVAVGLGLGAVHGFHGPGVSEGEGDGLASAGVGQPVPRVDALAADEQVGAERGDGGEEGVGFGGQVAGQADGAGGVEDADEQRPCVQVDADIRCSGGGQETHGEASGRG